MHSKISSTTNKNGFYNIMVKMTRPWSGKKDNLPSPKKKEQHSERKTIKQVLHELEKQDWEQQLKEYKNNASKPI